MLKRAIQFLLTTSIVFMMFLVVNGEESTPMGTKVRRHDHPEVPRISAYEAKKLFYEGKLLLANAHEPETFNRGHIIGSINLPGDRVQSMNVNLPRDIIVAFYCA